MGHHGDTFQEERETSKRIEHGPRKRQRFTASIIEQSGNNGPTDLFMTRFTPSNLGGSMVSMIEKQRLENITQWINP